MDLLVLVAVGLGGALGALCRHYASTFLKPHFPFDFPLPTLLINITSCTIAGFSLYLCAQMDQTFYLALTMGFLGGFSTLSSMNYEAAELVFAGKGKTGAAYLCTTYAATLGAAACGYLLASLFL